MLVGEDSHLRIREHFDEPQFCHNMCLKGWSVIWEWVGGGDQTRSALWGMAQIQNPALCSWHTEPDPALSHVAVNEFQSQISNIETAFGFDICWVDF
jgi:hypothetical protein